jgi:hypothetical protein
LRMMKSSDGGLAGAPENRLTARSNDPHHALTGGRAPPIRSAVIRQHERGAGGGSEVGSGPLLEHSVAIASRGPAGITPSSVRMHLR